MERRFLKAKRHHHMSGDSMSSHQSSHSRRSSISSTSTSSSTTYHNRPRAEGAKNIASDRMKRLRKSLQQDLEDANSSGDFPPAKRFAAWKPSETQHDKATNRGTNGTNYKSPRKNFIQHTSTSSPIQPKTSLNKRLRDVVTSTPEPAKVKCVPHFPNSSGARLLNDEDVNILDISASGSNYCSNVSSSTVSNVSLLCHANNSTRNADDFENMDWSPVSEEQLLSNLREAREMFADICDQKQLNNNDSFTVPSGFFKSNNIYVVVDTNIFIDKLQTVINIMHISYTDKTQPVIYAPWMVIQELEYFKHGYNVSEKNPVSRLIQARCRKAVRFINDTLIAGKQNFKGQPVGKAAEGRIIGQSPDDSILASCMQLQSDGCEVVLLSSDINLRNKALINNIRAYSPNDIIKELKKKATNKEFNFAEAICTKLSLICSFILHFEMKAHYGQQEYENKSFKDLPWQFRDCIKYLSEHYDPVFRSFVPKQCRKVVDDLGEMLGGNEEIANEVKFMELCLSLLIYLQTGLPKYDANIQHTIQEIKQIETQYLT